MTAVTRTSHAPQAGRAAYRDPALPGMEWLLDVREQRQLYQINFRHNNANGTATSPK